VIVELLLWPRYICRILDIPVTTYLWQAWGRTALAMVPFTAGCMLAEKYWPAHNLAAFFLQIGTLLPLVPLALAVVFGKGAMAYGQNWLKERKTQHCISKEYESSVVS
jgi:hypothetical protein